MLFERTKQQDGFIVVRVQIGEHNFVDRLPAPAPGTEGLPPVAWTDSAYADWVSVAEDIERINSDQRMSEFGKAERRTPLLSKAVQVAAKFSAALDDYTTEIGRDEKAIYALPDLNPAATVSGLRERELRDWYRGLNGEELKAVRTALAEAGNEEMLAALMRSPIPWGQADRELFTNAWRTQREAMPENQVALASLALRRAAEDRARRAAYAIGAHVRTWTGLDNVEIAKTLLASDNDAARRGHGAFAIAPQELAIAKARLDAERRAAMTA